MSGVQYYKETWNPETAAQGKAGATFLPALHRVPFQRLKESVQTNALEESSVT